MTFKRETFLQLLATIPLIAALGIIHFLLDKFGIPIQSVKTFYTIVALIFLTITWLYVITGLQLRKDPKLLQSSIWRRVPIIIIILSIVSLIGVLLLMSLQGFAHWVETSKLFLYLMIIYFLTLYFYFIMSLVIKFRETKDNIIHHTYGWALFLMIIIGFLI